MSDDAILSKLKELEDRLNELWKKEMVKSSDFAVAANGVTNGDAHDHSGGDGAQIAYSTLSGIPQDLSAGAGPTFDHLHLSSETVAVLDILSGVCLLPAGPSTYDLFTATYPTGSNGLYMVILSQQGGTNNSQAIAYVVCYGAAAGAIVLQSQNSVTIGTNGAVVRAVAAAGFGATTMNWTAIRLR